MTTVTGTTERMAAAERVLLHRRGTLYLPSPGTVTAPGEHEIALLEADLLERGYLLSAQVRDALAVMGPEPLGTTARALLAEIDEALGADRPHVPLFRGFPASVPADTAKFFVDRIFALLLQEPAQPCVLCGESGVVRPVSPCAHLVCGSCFDGSDLSACPICHRRIDRDDPFLRPAPPRTPGSDQWVLPRRMRVLHLGTDLAGDLATELAGLLARTSAPSPAETDDLATLLETRSREDLAWLPERIPSREIKAHVLAWLLTSSAAPSVAASVAAVTARVDTATDVLRILVLRSGGDAGLVTVPRFGAVPRPLRRTLLAVLDGLGPARLTEDLSRHARLWKRAAEKLHPFEYTRRFPTAALAFAVIRGTSVDAGWPTAAVRASSGVVASSAGRLRHRSWSARVETALAADDAAGALALLRSRPGELLRRLDHLLRVAGGEDVSAVLAAVPPAARRVSSAVLMSALGQLRRRDRPVRHRVFFPKGGTAKAHVVPEKRPALPPAVIEAVTGALTDEALRRAALLPAAECAVIDAELDGLIAPFTERTASRALVTLPRGSALPLPDVRHLRFFLHWMENDPGPVVDLDLSLALFDDAWRHVGTCDYTSRRFQGDAAVHSGDLTSAPPPDGSSEFIDLDVEALTTKGVRHIVAVVFSYNGVAFAAMAEAFAGFMALTGSPETGEVFDPRTVEQRFDLTGRAYASVPVIIDLNSRQLRWLDMTAAVTGYGSAVHNQAGMLATLGGAMSDLYNSGSRVSLGELATWHAAARARTVLLRHPDGSLDRFVRGDDEPVREFATRVASWGLTDEAGDHATRDDAASASLQFLVRGDLPTPEDASVYALHPAMLDSTRVRLLTASDLAAQLNASALPE